MVGSSLNCAKWVPDNPDCQKEGKFTCKNCHLVVYCGASCQKAHWAQHKVDCKTALNNSTWLPAWAREDRMPAFLGGLPLVSLGMNKYLWGNVPAFDLIQLEKNEGLGYTGDLRLLFAASGDLRNVVKTISRIPPEYGDTLEITVNDRDFDIVGRNVILLLIALSIEDKDEAIDCMIHLWYSALVRESDLQLIQRRIRTRIQNVCKTIENNKLDGPAAKTWRFGDRSLRLVLEAPSWNRLLSFFDVPTGLKAERAQEIRRAVTLAEAREDYYDRFLYCQSPAHRLAHQKFREEGLLLPFGLSSHEFCVPNPTLYQNTLYWTMNDNADPLHGWPSDEVAALSTGPATADLYGKLFFYLRKTFEDFLVRLRGSKVSFTLYQHDVTSLVEQLDTGTFSRIEVSNISDAHWFGIHRTLNAFVPFLQHPKDNPHATLVTLFMNAIAETLDKDKFYDLPRRSLHTTRRVLRYIPLDQPPISPYDPRVIKFNMGMRIASTYDTTFDQYMSDMRFHEAGAFFGAAMKDRHTIIAKWPFQLQLRPGQPGAQEKFERRMGDGMSGKERYVEWRRR
ncbi:hypothetical protein BDW62DRAFT_217950 [Aspergillus aurantiobrunneus]